MPLAMWTTRDGEVVAIGRMTDQHLRNTIRYLRRNAQRMVNHSVRLAYAMEGYFGDHTVAADLADQVVSQAELTPAEYLRENTPYETMLRHAKRRGLNIEPWEEDDELQHPAASA